MLKSNLLSYVVLAFTLTLLVLACSTENQDDNEVASVAIQWGSYTTAFNESKMNPNHKSLLGQLFAIESSNAAVSNLTACFKRLRFKKLHEDDTEPETIEDSIDFSLGEVDIDGAGTFLGNVSVPVDIYSRVEFDLESDCASGHSLQLTNSNGSFNSQDRITIRFEGTLEITGDGTLNLNVQQILDALNDFNTPGDSQALKNEAESIAGVL